MLKRAWLIHSIKTIYMVMDATTSDAFWEKKADPDCLSFNTDIVESIGQFIIIAIWIALGASVFLDIICWRWNKVACVLFYLECGQILLENLVPQPA